MGNRNHLLRQILTAIFKRFMIYEAGIIIIALMMRIAEEDMNKLRDEKNIKLVLELKLTKNMTWMMKISKTIKMIFRALF